MPQPTASAPAEQPPSAGGGVSQAMLANVLASVMSRAAPEQLPSLAEVLTPQAVVPLLQDPAVQRRLGELIEHLPAEHQAEASDQVIFRNEPLLLSEPVTQLYGCYGCMRADWS